MRTPLSLALLAVALLASSARAEVSIQINPKTLASSKKLPTLTASTDSHVDDLILTLTGDNGARVNLRSGKLRPGEAKVFSIPAPRGRPVHYRGTLVARTGRAGMESAVNFTVELVDDAKLSFDPAKVDLEGRTLVLTSTRPTASVEVSVTGESGGIIGEANQDFEAEANTPMTIRWRQSPEKALKIAIKAYDPDGFWTGLEIFPWRIDIPHEEIQFQTGKADILPDQAPKLDTSLVEIHKAIEKAGQFAPIKLFVVGHTDSVGSADANRPLSLARARSISAYFRKKGLKLPIFYAGLGEDALKVQTPDETPEIANRRAEYIVAIESPPLRGGHKFTPLK